MKTITVLGAGYMGSAICFPLAERIRHINLWGTWLDDDIVDSCREGEHPKIKLQLPKNVRLYNSQQLTESLEDSDMVIIGVSSEGFAPVFSKLLDEIKRETPVLSLTKGFVLDGGIVEQISVYARKEYNRKFPAARFVWGSIGGPVKAAELSAGVPTNTVYGLMPGFPGKALKLFSTDYYRVITTDDVKGVEICSALKNAYAIAIGICDGLYRDYGTLHDNIKAFMFSHAVQEMGRIVEEFGGRAATAAFLAGAGDLFVTAQSGRNRNFGELIGRGIKPDTALATMMKEGDIAEGYHAVKYGQKFIQKLYFDTGRELPLFHMLYRILFDGGSLENCIEDFIRTTGF
ncbi:MAG: NAD(P)H-dependent glycerol-3-phosphate dehydrogenase [Spirochaetota bacterium]|nr:NAD(P)H-dependent glycerol-3-phosphate dehydrogenase [Spirochaetota bacterium]